MPKKTKKEKLLALYHKKLSLLENRPTAPSTTVSPKFSPLVQIHKNEIKVVQVSDEEKQLNKYFLSDLKKSLILIAIIIGLELSLYAFHFVK